MDMSMIINSRNLKIATGVLAAASLVSLAVDFVDEPNKDIHKDLDDLSTPNEPVDAFKEA